MSTPVPLAQHLERRHAEKSQYGPQDDSPRSRLSPTPFRAKEISPSAAIFESRAHDVPRAIYRLVGPDDLHGRIEGERGGQLRGKDFPAEAGEVVWSRLIGEHWRTPGSRRNLDFGVAP